MNPIQKVFLRYTPASVQNVGLSIWGYQIHRFRYTPYFYRRLAELESTATTPLEQLYEIQRERLMARVEWARQYVPRYRDLPRPSAKKNPLESIRETLDAISPLEKNEYAKDPIGFLGTDRSRIRLVKNNSSGTTGTALEFWHTREALAEEYATVWRMYRRMGIELHDPRLSFGGNVVVPFSATSPPFWRTNYYGAQTLFSTYHMKPENLGVYVSAIHRMRGRWVQGYPSSLYLMARALLDSGRPLPRGRLAGVFSSSERLLAFHREAIEAAFSAPLINRYGTSEFAVSMTSCEKNRLHVDMEFGIVEVEPIESDETTVRGSLLVTGLAPDAIPFFRYRIGDIGTRCNQPCPCGRPGETFLDVEGREDDFVMTPDGRLIGRLDHIFKGQSHIAEAQILQDRKEAIRVLVVPRIHYSKTSEQQLMRKIRERLGEEIEIEIATVSEIAREPNGKFRAVKSEVGKLHLVAGWPKPRH